MSHPPFVPRKDRPKAARPSRITALLAILCVISLFAAACQGAQETTPGTGLDDDVDVAAFCEAVIAGEARFLEEPETDDQGNPTEEAMERLRNDMEPYLSDVEENTPSEIEEEVSAVVDGVRTALEEGDTAAVESPEFFRADMAVDEYVFDNCELDQKVEVAAVDYAFQEVPEDFSAGQTGLRLQNRGSEVHEAVVFRINDGVEMSIQELLDLPEEEAEGNIQFAGATFAGPGESGATVVDFTPGRYAFVCFIPLGSTSLEALFEEGGEQEGTPTPGASPTGTGTPTGTASPSPAASPSPTGSPAPGAGEGEEEGPPPHFTRGMFVEFTVS